MIETGKILALRNNYINENYLLFQGKNEKYLVEYFSEIGNVEIGKIFSINIIHYFYNLNYLKNKNGKFKLISIFDVDVNTKLIYRIEDTREIILVDLAKKIDNFNNLILGDLYDLDLIDTYVGIDYYKNLPENKNCLNEEILILNIIDENHFLALRKEETIFLTTNTKIDAYIGETILMTIYKKGFAPNIQIGTTFSIGKNGKFLFNLSSGLNKYISLDDEDFIFNNRTLLTDNNSGKTLTINYVPIKLGVLSSFQESIDVNNGFELININKKNEDFSDLIGGEFIFRNVALPTESFACYFVQDIDLNNKLGSIFTFLYFDYYKLLILKI